jgi:ferredoxin
VLVVRADLGQCQGYANCVLAADDVFDIARSGRSRSAVGPADSGQPPRAVAAAQRAAARELAAARAQQPWARLAARARAAKVREFAALLRAHTEPGEATPLDVAVPKRDIGGAQTCATAHPGGIMALIFVAIDPGTDGDHCPAVFVEEETGDLLFQGWTVTDPQTLTDVSRHSPIADNESVVRLPARMRAIIMEALNGQGATIQRADRSHYEVSDTSGDA